MAKTAVMEVVSEEAAAAVVVEDSEVAEVSEVDLAVVLEEEKEVDSAAVKVVD